MALNSLDIASEGLLRTGGRNSLVMAVQGLLAVASGPVEIRAESIMAAIVAAVTGLATTGANVHLARAYPVEVGELPALLVWQDADLRATEMIIDLDTARLTVNLDALAREPAGQIETTLNLIREEVTVALMADYMLGLAYVEEIEERAAEEPNIVGVGDAPVGSLRTVWSVTYHLRRTSPAN